MTSLWPYVRAYALARGQQWLVREVGRSVVSAVEHHLPVGGSGVAFEHILAALDWREQLIFARCSSATLAAMSALFGSAASPLRVRPHDVPNVVRSRVARLARHLTLDCAGDNRAVTQETLDAVRSLPLLRHLTFAEFDTPDNELLVLLTRRPVPELLQSLRIEQCGQIHAQAMACFRVLPALHSLALYECTLHGATLLDDLPACAHLHTLALNFAAGTGFTADSLRPIFDIPQLKRLHLHTLCVGLDFLQPIARTLLTSDLFAHRLECLSLCYTRLRTTDVPLLANSTALRRLELSWVSPLASILSCIAKLPRLESLLLGDDHFATVEEYLLRHLLGAPALSRITLYGFAGVPNERFRQLQTEVAHATKQFHLRCTVRYFGDRRKRVLHHLPEFDWAR